MAAAGRSQFEWRERTGPGRGRARSCGGAETVLTLPVTSRVTMGAKQHPKSQRQDPQGMQVCRAAVALEAPAHVLPRPPVRAPATQHTTQNPPSPASSALLS